MFFKDFQGPVATWMILTNTVQTQQHLGVLSCNY